LPGSGVPCARIVFRDGTGGGCEGDADAGIDDFLPFGFPVFKSNGSVESAGGIRFGDGRGNVFEVKIDPPATGKTEIKKYNREFADFLPRGRTEASGPTWVWYNLDPADV
jgi:hypothetical protein